MEKLTHTEYTEGRRKKREQRATYLISLGKQMIESNKGQEDVDRNGRS